jgi:hypothetical protein
MQALALLSALLLGAPDSTAEARRFEWVARLRTHWKSLQSIPRTGEPVTAPRLAEWVSPHETRAVKVRSSGGVAYVDTLPRSGDHAPSVWLRSRVVCRWRPSGRPARPTEEIWIPMSWVPEEKTWVQGDLLGHSLQREQHEFVRWFKRLLAGPDARREPVRAWLTSQGSLLRARVALKTSASDLRRAKQADSDGTAQCRVACDRLTFELAAEERRLENTLRVAGARAGLGDAVVRCERLFRRVEEHAEARSHLARTFATAAVKARAHGRFARGQTAALARWRQATRALLEAIEERRALVQTIMERLSSAE